MFVPFELSVSLYAMYKWVILLGFEDDFCRNNSIFNDIYIKIYYYYIFRKEMNKCSICILSKLRINKKQYLKTRHLRLNVTSSITRCGTCTLPEAGFRSFSKAQGSLAVAISNCFCSCARWRLRRCRHCPSCSPQ